MNYTTYLVHHGIKGQRWGIRRYQNADGTLTEAGRKRYLKEKGLSSEWIKSIKRYSKEKPDAALAVLIDSVSEKSLDELYMMLDQNAAHLLSADNTSWETLVHKWVEQYKIGQTVLGDLGLGDRFDYQIDLVPYDHGWDILTQVLPRTSDQNHENYVDNFQKTIDTINERTADYVWVRGKRVPNRRKAKDMSWYKPISSWS